MKVKLKNQYCGPRGSHGPGCVIDLPDEEAKQLIGGGYAEAVNTAPVAAPVEVVTETSEEEEEAEAETSEEEETSPKRRGRKPFGSR